MTPDDDARAIHQDAIIVDGLVWYSDGNTDELHAANLAAINLTVQFTDVEADFAVCLDDIAGWLNLIERPDSGWRLVLRSDDILQAREAGQIGVIMDGRTRARSKTISIGSRFCTVSACASCSRPITNAPSWPMAAWNRKMADFPALWPRRRQHDEPAGDRGRSQPFRRPIRHHGGRSERAAGSDHPYRRQIYRRLATQQERRRDGGCC